MKTLVVAIINNLIVFCLFWISSNIIYRLTGQYVDQVGVTSVLSAGISISILIGLISYEKTKFEISLWANCASSVFLGLISSIIIVFAIAYISGSIG